MENCLGCRLANKQERTFMIYENDHVACFLDHVPHHPGHTLILPKQHKIELTELNKDESLFIMEASKLVARTIQALYGPNGITICQNGGIYNELTHYHMHVIPRNEEPDRFGDLFYGNAEIGTHNESIEETHIKMKTTINRLLEEE
ncbi:HIT family protein (plasmid) [Cytobacillus spongiae]|uniref:HIT family protein n=1 Tax=Cytobacillus spongiae TaxID=2901381 RepID=UPI00145EFB58|nr:HIT family protein [Cytobacillus spongiae]MCA1062693.1 HIT family protein [Rossellomorea aquimaris]NMH70032.1 HIT family protein [Bacillus sp. RO3]UII58320.1 HIT family protein [Cytobacillus spongiae]WJV28640.1 HIT family protein [Rossellomorea sp. AcN35-11]